MSDFFASRLLAFRHAFRGISYILRSQKNAWVHTFFTVAVLLLAGWLRLPTQDWALIILVSALVWMAEALNTAIEAVVDLASPNMHPLAKTAKDVGAAAVLLAALAAVVVGLLVLGPPLLAQFLGAFE